MRTILITGASGGLIQEMVPLLADDFLILLGRDKKKMERLYAAHANKLLLDTDIRDETALKEMLDQLEERIGKIDILVNNAGYGRFAEFHEFSSQEVRDMFEINTVALMTLSRLVGERMKSVQKGQIINIVSMAGLIASSKASVYSATKFAAMGFSNALRLELAASNVVVTTVNPGPIATTFFEQADPDGAYLTSVRSFLLQPEDVARKIVRVMGTKKRELNLPWMLLFAYKCYALFPKLADFLARTVFNYK